MNVIFSLIINITISFDIISLIIQFLFSVGLYRGIRWIRWLFVIGELSGALVMFLLSFNLLTTYQFGINIFAFFMGIVLGINGLLLIFNKGVSEFLYSQRVK